MGNDILVVLFTVQLILVLCNPTFQDVSTNISYVGPGWILHLRIRLCAKNGQMWIENQWTPPLQRFHDRSLMKAFPNIIGITQGILNKANHCRMYMKCIRISNLANT